ncbi:IclR family transcriptional regulator [Paraburkholderia sp. Ac-20342]|uniref:IclR family transcriptional regulator n=1 Tax=Paraburkholderia sp. Ac-20342 TaxID=2703889 RepID=UPI00197F50DA|nr:IclR family transcriptional regulator [Paraburkholderia sp. Ac-20342]MBN3849327.1 IclR family transcriptional regulator [Paraburkholderia sp. Ac-20342]
MNAIRSTGTPDELSVASPAEGVRASPADNPKNVVNSVAKAFSVLQCFSAGQHVLTIPEIAARSGIDRGTAFRLTHTLVSLGYLRPVAERRFRLTLKCLDLGYAALSSQDLGWHAGPLLEECVPDYCDAASVGVLEGADVVYLARVEQNLGRYNLDRKPGRRVRAYGAALGHVILAFMPLPRQVEVLASAERIKLSEHTLTDLDALLERLKHVREQGYAISDGENAYGLRTIATPVFDPDGNPVAGVSLTIDAQRMAMQEFVTLARSRAQAIATELGRALQAASGGMQTDPPHRSHGHSHQSI